MPHGTTLAEEFTSYGEPSTFNVVMFGWGTRGSSYPTSLSERTARSSLRSGDYIHTDIWSHYVEIHVI
jgi:hypothetical protein